MSNIQSAQARLQTTVDLAGHSEKAAAEALMARKYAECGYGEGHRLPTGCDTFIAVAGCTLVGTLSLAIDGADGLPSDRIFQDELDRFRASGASLCELTRFVVDRPSPSITILCKLLAAIPGHVMRNYDCTDVVITADARHRGFYRRKWGFECVGPAKLSTVSGVVSQLMRVPVAAFKPSNDNLRAVRPFHRGAFNLSRTPGPEFRSPEVALKVPVVH